MEIKPQLIEPYSRRLMANVQKLSNGCWVYKKGIESNGYTRIMVDWKRFGSHRLSWLIHRGNIPKGMFVCHKCDFPACVNPNHLFLGTQQENLIDCTRKGRLASAKLKVSDIPVIRDLLSKGKTLRAIAAKFSVHHKTIMCIKNRSQWGHV